MYCNTFTNCNECFILLCNVLCGLSVITFIAVQLFELGPDGGDHETDGDLLAETDVLAYDCAARYSLYIKTNFNEE